MSLLLDALRPEPSTAATLPEEDPLDAHATLSEEDPPEAHATTLPREAPLHAHTIRPQGEPLSAHATLHQEESPDTQATLPEEEPLDAHATLELLAPKPSANELLTLEPPADTATAAPAIVVPERVAEMARSPPMAARSLPPAAQAPEPPAQPSPVAQTNAPALDEAALAARRKKRYLLLLVASIAVAGIAMLGKSWWQPGPNIVSYPDGGEPQPPPGAPSGDTATPASTHAVQVSSERPADQFAYTGNAPEIDLRANESSPVTPVTPVTPITASTQVGSEPSAATAPGAKPTARRVRTTTSTLSVTRTKGLSPVDVHVEAGYRALASGDTASAQSEYLAALELDPNNVDALLGAATVAARDGKPAVAAQRYATVLKLEPGNPDATAAMTMLQHGEGNESAESRLKILIATDNSRPALHAALAGVYAADGRWTEAAQEYFAALGKDPGNPDLAFNVAASLDQNRNAAMALAYYKQTLEFARQRPAQVDLRAVERRIKQIEAALKKMPPAPETP
jgi:Tfp pilus assembly protein PilF